MFIANKQSIIITEHKNLERKTKMELVLLLMILLMIVSFLGHALAIINFYHMSL